MAKLIWQKSGKIIRHDGTIIIYENGGPYTIESRKRHIPHANRSGTWDHTSYFVLKNGNELIEKFSLKDAKDFAERVTRNDRTV